MSENLPAMVLYERMSSDEQPESVPEQRRRLYPHFQARYRIVEEYVDEGKSGSKNTEKRTAFLRMIHDVTVGKYSQGPNKVVAIGCLDLSRFGRLDTITGARHKEQIRTAGIVLQTVIDGEVDWRRSNDRIIDSVKSEGNHHLSLLIAEKGLQGRIRVTLEGKPNQPTPYGMAKSVTSPTGESMTIPRTQTFRTPKGWKSEFVASPDPREVEAVQYLFTTYATEDISFNELARVMNRKGFPSPTGQGWQGQYLRWMLRNPVYVGTLRIGDKPNGDFFRVQGTNSVAKGVCTAPQPVVNENAHEGIVDRQTWDRVQAKIKRTMKTRAPRLRKAGPYALSGIVHCGNCGRAMYASRDPHSGKIVYRCHRVEIGASTCGYWIAYERDLLPFLLHDFFADVRKDIAEQQTTVEVVKLDDQGDDLRAQLDRLDKRLGVSRQRYLEAPAAVAKGLLDTLQQLEAQRQSLVARITERQGTRPESALAQWWERYQREFTESNPVQLPTKDDDQGKRGSGKLSRVSNSGTVIMGTEGETAVVVRTTIPAAVLREKLKRIGVKISVWFVPKKRGRGYDLAKVQVQAALEPSLCYEYCPNDGYPLSSNATLEINRLYDGHQLRG